MAAKVLNGKGLESSALYWSQQGAISCGDHAPFKGSDTWRWDRWTKISERDLADIKAEEPDMKIACETCGHDTTTK